jgi:hypothetical protein
VGVEVAKPYELKKVDHDYFDEGDVLAYANNAYRRARDLQSPPVNNERFASFLVVNPFIPTSSCLRIRGGSVAHFVQHGAGG